MKYKRKMIRMGLLIVLISVFNIVRVEAATNPYVQKSPFGTNCTWYAWDQVYKKLGIALPGWGNANTWVNYAKKAGFETGMKPRAKSIVVWEWDNYGHVGYVERVSGNKIYVWDSAHGCIDEEDPEFAECIANSVDQESYGACYAKAKAIACEFNADYWKIPGDLIGYVYLDKVPTKQPTQVQKPTTTTPMVKKDSNAYLASLKISEGRINFKKDVLKYEIEVANEIESIKIEATTENAKAKVSGLGNHNLKVGENEIKVGVTAEDGTKKTYEIIVKRKDNNADLAKLLISNINFEFKKDILEYDIPVSADIQKITVEAETESKLAKIEGQGEYNLVTGENIIEIVVTAEDESKKTYTIKVIKEEPKEPVIEDKEEVPLSKKEVKAENKREILKYLIIGGSIIFILGSLLITIVILKHKKD